jgi:hypothetical protein
LKLFLDKTTFFETQNSHLLLADHVYLGRLLQPDDCDQFIWSYLPDIQQEVQWKIDESNNEVLGRCGELGLIDFSHENVKCKHNNIIAWLFFCSLEKFIF